VKETPAPTDVQIAMKKNKENEKARQYDSSKYS
jgi:hypothetical protein